MGEKANEPGGSTTAPPAGPSGSGGSAAGAGAGTGGGASSAAGSGSAPGLAPPAPSGPTGSPGSGHGSISTPGGYTLGRDETGADFLIDPGGKKAVWDPASHSWKDPETGQEMPPGWSAGLQPPGSRPTSGG